MKETLACLYKTKICRVDSIGKIERAKRSFFVTNRIILAAKLYHSKINDILAIKSFFTAISGYITRVGWFWEVVGYVPTTPLLFVDSSMNNAPQNSSR